MKRSFAHNAPKLGYVSSGFIPHNGLFNKVPKNNINSPMQKTRHPNNLKFIREYRGFSREKLAELAGTVKGQIYKLENEERKLTHSWMDRLAPVLRCSVSDFVIDPQKLNLDSTSKDDVGLRDSEVALIDAIKDIFQILLFHGMTNREALSQTLNYQSEHYREKNLPDAVQVMRELKSYIGGESAPEDQTVIQRLLQLRRPVGSA